MASSNTARDAADDGATGHEAADDKDRFREALERKRGNRHPHEGAARNDPKVHDTHSAAASKRMFRRKSG